MTLTKEPMIYSKYNESAMVTESESDVELPLLDLSPLKEFIKDKYAVKNTRNLSRLSTHKETTNKVLGNSPRDVFASNRTSVQ